MEEDKNLEERKIEEPQKEEDKEELNEDFIDETEEEVEQDDDKIEINMLKQQLQELDRKVENSKFARVETKSEFASEIVNSPDNQKIANLKDYEIIDLLEKRKFYNLLKNFEWNRLADRILCNIRDVENYSLSENGKFIDSVMTEQSKQATYSYNTHKDKKK